MVGLLPMIWPWLWRLFAGICSSAWPITVGRCRVWVLCPLPPSDYMASFGDLIQPHGLWWQLHTHHSQSDDFSSALFAELKTHRSICPHDKLICMTNRNLNWTRPKQGSCFPTHSFPAPLPPFPISANGTSIHPTAQAKNHGVIVASLLTPFPTCTSSQVLLAWHSKMNASWSHHF